MIPTMTVRRQSFATSSQKLPDAVVKSFSRATDNLSISLSLAVVFFLHVTSIKDKQMLVFNIIFDLLWTVRGSSASSVALF